LGGAENADRCVFASPAPQDENLKRKGSVTFNERLRDTLLQTTTQFNWRNRPPCPPDVRLRRRPPGAKSPSSTRNPHNDFGRLPQEGRPDWKTRPDRRLRVPLLPSGNPLWLRSLFQESESVTLEVVRSCLDESVGSRWILNGRPRFTASPLPRPATGGGDDAPAPPNGPGHDRRGSRAIADQPDPRRCYPVGDRRPTPPSAKGDITGTSFSSPAPRTSRLTTGLRLPAVAGEPAGRRHLEWIVLGFTGCVYLGRSDPKRERSWKSVRVPLTASRPDGARTGV